MSTTMSWQFDEKGGGGLTQADGPIFALDIGTHSVTGIVGSCEEGILRVWGVCQREYARKAMRDGQIEDIAQVAETAQKVRRELERELGASLDSVYVAAAGRSLRTQEASFELELEGGSPIQAGQVADLEMCAIQEAEEAVLAREEASEVPLYYVGHTVVRYCLDGYPIAKLLDHRGRRIRADIIATFLPGEVLESLRAVTHKIGLTVNSITLEPIAAMNAIIPRELRLLNLALVDIGAGTSDIAISDEGSVVAYTMVTTAGDEITEAVVKAFLVDPETAEQMKLALSEDGEEIRYQDILGFDHTVAPREVEERIRPAVENLCGEICDQLLAANGKPPAAVFMVGGGSKLRGLCPIVAQKLSIEENKVAVGGSNYMRKAVSSPQADVTGPEYATPIGIALTAMESRNDHRYSVTLNQKEVQIVSLRAATVMDLLLQNGYTQGQLLGRSGKSVTCTVDGRRRVERGGRATAAVITVNGQAASITTLLHPGDSILVTPAVSGADAAPTVAQMVEDYRQFTVQVNGAPVQAGTLVTRGGRPAAGADLVEDMDDLQVTPLWNVGDLCEHLGLDPERLRVFVNGDPAAPDRPLEPEDDVRYLPLSEAAPASRPAPPAAEEPPPGPVIRVTLNGAPQEVPPRGDGLPHQFVELLNFVDIDPQKPQGDIILRLNGRQASYLDLIQEGDVVEIQWDRSGPKAL